MKTIKKIIGKHSTGKKVLLLFVLTNIVYAVMLTVTIPKVMAFSNGMKLLDMMPTGYDAEYINALFEALGEQGRSAYLHNQLPVDMIYPFLFAICYCFMMGYFLKKTDKFDSALFYLCLLPLVAGIADYLENFGIISMLKNYPYLSKAVMKFTNYFSIVKSMTTTVVFIGLIILLLILGVNTLKNRKTNASG